MYVILARNGYTFASDGSDYVILCDGQEILRHMNKRYVEQEFMRISK